MTDKLRPADYRFVERLLYDQKTHDTAIAEMEAELDDMVSSCSASIIEGSSSGGEPGSQTEAAVIIRMDSVKGKSLQAKIRDKRRQKKAISEAMKVLTDTECQLVHIKYHLEKSSRECMQIMGYEKSHFYRMKNELVAKIGRFLGL